MENKIEKAIRLISQYMPKSNLLIKPTLFHSIRVGCKLWEKGAKDEVVIAAILHDSIEDTEITEEMILSEFGERVLELILANTKNESILDKSEKIGDLMTRCVEVGEDAILIKIADIIDNYDYYERNDEPDGVEKMNKNAKILLQIAEKKISDELLNDLREYLLRFSN